MWDLFISHASEDKATVVRPLAAELEALGLSVWVDEFTLTIGDSLRRKIEEGLARSQFGVVVLSPAFFTKDWPQRELNALVALGTRILPVWHDITITEVKLYSPLLADLVAVTSKKGMEHVAQDLLRAMNRE